MRMRAPSVPLITVDPYFSVWSPSDKLTDSTTVHWTGRPNTLLGYAEIDGQKYRFMGRDDIVPEMKQIGLEITALSTTYTFEAAGIQLTAIFTTPLLPGNLEIMTRPVSYLEIISTPIDGEEHSVYLTVKASEELCLNRAGDDTVETRSIQTDGGISLLEMGSRQQKVLERCGDDVRISWGYFYLGAEDAETDIRKIDGKTFVSASVSTDGDTLFVFAYDSIADMVYFGEHLNSVWNKDGKSIVEAIDEAVEDYPDVISECENLSRDLFCNAVRAGGEKYAEMLELAFRQTIGAHKCVLDGDGEILFISKECFSNGCAATVDVSYPSIPLFLAYNPELVKGMMRPILKFALSDAWEYDFAPHDCGTYPFVNGEKYTSGSPENEMPVEECGNMLVMAAAVSIAEQSSEFAMQYIDLFEKWVKYLIENGEDPDNQLCTDDFAGHMAHNCNLSVKSVMGIAGLAIIYGLDGDDEMFDKYMDIAEDMADSFAARSENSDGSLRLAYDREGSWSMKYNMVWDKLFGTKLFRAQTVEAEVAANIRHRNTYGMPLDCRATYTKSDWLIWTATLAADRDRFELFANDLWNAYNSMPQRVPMTDWYYTLSADQVIYDRIKPDNHPKGFQNRTVLGGLYIKLLEYTGKMRVRLWMLDERNSDK